MDTLICTTPGLGETHARYTQFTEDDELRELAFAREKYERDHLARLTLAERKGREEGLYLGLAKGRAEGREEGRAEGELLMGTRMLTSILQARFSEAFPLEDQIRITSLTDAEFLNALILKASMASDYAEIREMLD